MTTAFGLGSSQQIDPDIQRRLMAGEQIPGWYTNRTQGYWENGYGPEAGGNYIQPDGASTWTLSRPLGNNMVEEWLGDGSYRGINQDTSRDYQNGETIVKALIAAAAGYGAYSGITGAGAAAGGAGTASPELLSAMGAGSGGGGGAGAVGTTAAAAGGSGTPWYSSLLSGLTGSGGTAAGGNGMWGQLLNTVVGAGLNYAMRPDSPDYGALGDQQARNNLQAALLNTSLNRPNITSPYGSQTWETIADPNSPGGFRTSTNITLSPEQRQLYEQQVGMQLGQGRTAQGLLDQYSANASTPFNLGSFGPQSRMGRTDRLYEGDGGIHFSQNRQTIGQGPSFSNYGAGPQYQGVGGNSLGAFELGSREGPGMGRVSGQGPAARDLYGATGYEGSRDEVEAAYQRRLQRLRGDQMAQDMTGLETKLKNMGLTEGTEAYDREMRNLRQAQMTEQSDWADRAILAGGQEQSRLAGLDLAADAQRFGQQQQGFNNELAAFGFNNNASQQEFSNYLAGLQQRNQARQAGTSDDIARAGFGNTWARQEMEDQRTAVDQINNTAQRGFENERLSAQHNNQAYGEEYGRYLQALTTDQALRSGRSAEDNSLRSQAIAEALMARRLPLEDFNSIRTGVNPTLPQAAFGGAGSVNPVNPMVSAQAGYQADMANYNANTALLQQILNSFAQARGGGGGGAFSLGQPGGYTPEDLSYFYG